MRAQSAKEAKTREMPGSRPSRDRFRPALQESDIKNASDSLALRVKTQYYLQVLYSRC